MFPASASLLLALTTFQSNSSLNDTSRRGLPLSSVIPHHPFLSKIPPNADEWDGRSESLPLRRWEDSRRRFLPLLRRRQKQGHLSLVEDYSGGCSSGLWLLSHSIFEMFLYQPLLLCKYYNDTLYATSKGNGW